ncbi:MAG: nucleotidyltransferase domain-containing protein [Deltaproteobacteria bacterium]|nr:nucleotidyltransferase domain-containing protein [Deltaproteobacteria bacterium]
MSKMNEKQKNFFIDPGTPAYRIQILAVNARMACYGGRPSKKERNQQTSERSWPNHRRNGSDRLIATWTPPIMFAGGRYFYVVFMCRLSVERALLKKTQSGASQEGSGMDKGAALEILSRFRKAIESQQVKVDKPILFGSYATGANREKSEIDEEIVHLDLPERPPNPEGLTSVSARKGLWTVSCLKAAKKGLPLRVCARRATIKTGHVSGLFPRDGGIS